MAENTNAAKLPTLAEILAMKVDELKQSLQAFGVDVKGDKAELQVKLIEHVQTLIDSNKKDAKGSKSSGGSTPYASQEGSRPSSPFKIGTKADKLKVVMVELQLKLRQLELEAEQRKLDAEQRKLEIEAEQRKIELDTERRKIESNTRLELERQAAEREKLKMQQEHEFAMRQLELQNTPASGVASTSIPITSGFRVDSAVKLVPKFNESDVESFLASFEKIAQINSWPADKYTAILQAHLTGKALKVFTQLSLTECQDYPTLKAALLTAYAVVPEVYRKRFRTIKKFYNETYSEFAFRLNMQFKRWTEGEGAFAEVARLRELIQLEQFRLGLESDLTVWLIDQKPTTLVEAARLADQFTALRSSLKLNKSQNFSKISNDKCHFEKGSDTSVQADVNIKASHDRPKPDNQNTLQFTPKWKPKPTDRPENQVICAYCKKPGHSISVCRQLQAKQETKNDQNSGVHFVSTKGNIQNQSDPIRGDYINAGYKNHCISVDIVRPDNSLRSATFLRDTGCLQSLINRQTIRETDYSHTGEYRLIKGISGEVQKVPLVEIRIHSKPVTGFFLCGLIENLPQGIDGLIGNDLCPNTVVTDVLAVTRSQTAAMQQHSSTVSDVTPDSARSVEQNITATVPSATDLLDADNDLNLAQLFSESNVITKDELIRLQSLDADLAPLFALANKIQEQSVTERSYYFLQDGVLMRSWRDKLSPPQEERQQIVVPHHLRLQLLHLAHDTPFAGHLGTAKTLQRLLQHFYWPSISESTRLYCKTCDVCQRLGKGSKPLHAPLHSLPLVTEPFSQIAIDIIGPLPKCKDSGNRFVLTVLDLCTHYPEAIALREHTAAEVARALLTVFSHFGFPSELLSDNGTEFTSELMQIFLHDYHITHINSSPSHPQTNGACERFNGTLKSMLKAVCDNSPDEWDKILPWVLFAYREVPVATLGLSPFELLFGRVVPGPLLLVKNAWLNKGNLQPTKSSVVDFILQIRENLRLVLNSAHEYAVQQRSKAKLWYDKKARDRQFAVGDKVLALLPIPKKPLHVKYYGPYEIAEKLGPVDYVLITPDRRKTRRVCHVNLLKAYNQRDENLIAKTPSSSNSIMMTFTETSSETMDEAQKNISSQSLENREKEDIQKLCTEFSEIFSEKPGRTTLCTHHIELMPTSKPIRCVPYRLNPEKAAFLKQEIQELLKQGVIEESQSAYASPVVLVPKADSKSLRLCCDFRKLNSVTIADPFPMARVEDLIDRVGKAKYLTKLDMVRGYWQVPLDEESIPLSAFVTPFGHFQWKVMAFGLRNAPATFTRLVSRLVHGLDSFCAAYLDDILIFTDGTWQDHLKHLRIVLTRIRNAGLTLNVNKCVFGVAEVDYLGHRIGLGQVKPSEKKVQALLDFPLPTNRKQLQSYLGLAGYYRKFLPNFSQIVSKLTDLLKIGVKFEITPEAEKAILDLKSRLATRPILRPPNFELPFCLAVDASNVAVAASLFQVIDGVELPICFFSRKLDKHQQNYSTIEKEAFALLLAVRTFSVYFNSTPVTVYTDHNPLVFLHKMANHNQKLLRWSLELQQFNITIIHRSGKDNFFPDLLSRPSITQEI